MAIALYFAGRHLAAQVASGAIERAVVQAARDRLGLELELGAIRVATFPVLGIEKVRIRGVSEDLLTLGALRVRLDVSDYLSGRLVLDEVRLVAPEIRVVKGPDGALNFRELARKIRAHRKARAEAAKSPQTKEVEGLLREMRELEEGLPPRRGAPRRGPPPTRPASPPAAPTAAPIPASERLSASRVRLRRFVIEAGHLQFRDESLGPDPFRADLEGLDLEVRLPAPGKAEVDAVLGARLLGAPLRVEATVDVDRLTGPVAFRLDGLPLGAVQPYLARRVPLPVDLGRIPLSLDGRVVLAGREKPREYAVDLAVPESKIRVTYGLTQVALGVGVDAKLTPDRVELRRLGLDLAGALGVEVSGAVSRFADPYVEGRVRTTRFDLPGLLPLIPPGRGSRLKALHPRLELALDARVEGTLRDRDLRPDVTLELGPGGVELPLGDSPLPVEFAKSWVRLDDEDLAVTGLECAVGGVRVLEGDLHAEGWRGLPLVRLRAAVPGVAVAEAADALRGRLPAGGGLPEKLARLRALDPRGSVAATLGTTLNLAILGEVPGLHEVTDLRDLARRVRSDPEVAAALRDPEQLGRLAGAGLADLRLDLAAEDIGVVVRRDGHEIPVAAEGRLRLDRRGVTLPAIRVRALGAAVTARGGVGFAPEGPAREALGLDLPQLKSRVRSRIASLPDAWRAPARDLIDRLEYDLSVHAGGRDGGPLEVADLASHLPEDRRRRLEAAAARGKVEVSAALRGRGLTPSPSLRVGVLGAGASVPTSHGPDLEVGLESLALELDDAQLVMPPAEIRTPLGPIRLAAKFADLLGKKRFKARVLTPGKGLNLLAAAPFLPEEKRAKLAAAGLERADLDLRVDLGTTLTDPGARVRATLTLPDSRVDVAGTLKHLLGARDLDLTAETDPRGVALHKLVEKLPAETRAKLASRIRGALPGALHLGVRVLGSLRDKPSLEARALVGLGLPGGELRLKARVRDPAGDKRFRASLEGGLARFTELIDLLPEEKADRLVALGLTGGLRLDASARGTPEAIDGDLQVSLPQARLRPRVKGELLPIEVDPLVVQADFQVVPRRGRPPLIEAKAAADLSAVASHPKYGPLPVTLALRDVRYDGEDLRLGVARLRALGQPVELTGAVTGLKGARELNLRAKAQVRVREILRQLVPPEAEIRSNGVLEVDGTIGGTPVRPTWDAALRLRDLFLDAYHLKGIPVAIPAIDLKATTDDLVVEPFSLRVGAKTSEIFLSGSLKEMIQEDNFWEAYKADRDKVVERLKEIVKAKGGKAAVVKMVGTETLLRLLGSSRHKIFVHVEARDLDRPHTFKSVLEPDESAEFAYRTDEIIAKYKRVALEQVYGKLGTTEKLFGRSPAEMVPVREVYVVVLDNNFNMVYPEQIPFWRLVTTPAKF